MTVVLVAVGDTFSFFFFKLWVMRVRISAGSGLFLGNMAP